MAVFSDQFIQKLEEIVRRRLIRHLRNIGEACVAEAVNNGDYQDITGNLRSSIGYVVAEDGVVREEGGFYTFGYGDGSNIGRAKAHERVADTEGVVLVIVAGMKYAEYVADKGYDVLASAETMAQKLIQTLRT